jgi:hypothetical protein
VQFNMLRTANATAMVALAVDIKTAQTRVGHRPASTTLDIYAQPSKTADRAAAEALGSHFLPAADEGSDRPPENPAQTMGERPPRAITRD